MNSFDWLVIIELAITNLIVLGVLIYLYRKQRELRSILPQEETSKAVKILSVIAGPDLDKVEIEKTLYSTDINYTLLTYDSVSKDSLLAELSKRVTIFELSSHGLNGEFRLGNSTIPIEWLSRALKGCKDLQCILLLYCNSYLDLPTLKDEGRYIIGLIGDVADKSCITFARHFYYYLDRKYGYAEAFEASRLHLPVEDFGKFILDGNL